MTTPAHRPLREGMLLGALVATAIWAWIAVGNVVGAVLTVVILWRRHPLRQEFREAMGGEEE